MATDTARTTSLADSADDLADLAFILILIVILTRGLVSRPEEWMWSSFRHYRTGESGTVEIESTWTAGSELE